MELYTHPVATVDPHSGGHTCMACGRELGTTVGSGSNLQTAAGVARVLQPEEVVDLALCTTYSHRSGRLKKGIIGFARAAVLLTPRAVYDA